ncbi:hypothetical protein GCM10007857_42870 [Bradyrhizobium iriomotense]|uniref:Uncharacterized protein n=1 Tax=Bradyrhizobium iriomotense TaxID=441950 RepID=A0ABQ6B4M7_9BRAD|nr:hypothetical protein GCM10007857_42870 [Bradyrhizobium iriomotense]
MGISRLGNGNYYALHEIWDFVVEKLEEAPGLRCVVQERSTLLFLSCAGLIGYLDLNGREIRNEADFAAYLLNGFALNVTVPGDGVSGRPCIGLPLTKPAAELESVCNRIIAACVALLSEPGCEGPDAPLSALVGSQQNNHWDRSFSCKRSSEARRCHGADASALPSPRRTSTESASLHRARPKTLYA